MAKPSKITAAKRALFFAATIAAFLLAPSVGLGVHRAVDAEGFYVVTTVAGSGVKGHADGQALKAAFNWPTGVVLAQGGIYVADYQNHMVRKISPDGEVTTIIGPAKGAPAGDAPLKGPDNVDVDAAGKIYIADTDHFQIKKASPIRGMITIIAGSGKQGYADGAAMDAAFAYPTGIALSKDGLIFIADRGAHAIRLVTSDGTVRTMAGGEPGFLDGAGKAARLNEPLDVAMGPDGAVYFTDSANNAVRRLSPDGVVTTIAGGAGAGYRDGKAKDALFKWPTGIDVDSSGNIFVCDSANNRIRRISKAGFVSTVAGIAMAGSLDGAGHAASFSFPTGVDVTSDGTIYVADSANNRIRKIEWKAR